MRDLRPIVVHGFFLATLLAGLVFPAAAQEEIISAANAFRLGEMARLGRGKVYNARFSPDGRQILVGSSLGIWTYPVGALDTPTEPTLLPTAREAEFVDVSPDGKTIYVGYSDIVQVWINGEITYAMDTGRRISALALSRDGNLLATAHSNNTIQFRHNLNAAPIIPQGYSIGVRGFAFSPDGSLLATGSDDGSLGIWSIDQRITLSSLRNEVDVRVLKFLPDGSAIVAADNTGGTRVRDNDSSISVIVIETGAGISALAFTPDSALIVTGNEAGIVSLWDAETATLRATFDEIAHRRAISALAISPDGALLASGGKEGDIQLWDIRNGRNASGDEVEAWIQPERGGIASLQFSPDGRLLLVSAAEEFVGLYAVNARALLMSAAGHTDDIIAFDFSPDSDQITLADDDGNVWIWRVGSAREITQIPRLEALGNSRESRNSLQYAPDGSFVAVNGRSDVYLIDPAGNAPLRVLDVDGSPADIAISPDSALVAVAGNRNLSIFSVESGLLVAKIDIHTDRLLGARFSPDQRLLASASADGSLRVFGLDT